MNNLNAVSNSVDGKLIGENVSFSGVSIDSRTIKSGELFFALTGPNFNGHDFIEMAIENGAVGAVVTQDLSIDFPVIKVSDAEVALADLGQAHAREFPIPFIALTGSCGKTTTKEMLAAIFSEKGSVLSTSGNYNNHLGVPLTLLRLNKDHRFAVIELGANNPGEIAFLTKMVSPDAALITNAGACHLDGFGTVHGVANAKGEIFSGLKDDGIAVINADDEFAGQWRGLCANKKVFSFGLKKNADVKAKIISLKAESSHFTLLTPQGEVEVNLAFPGEHNVMNALAAATVGLALGLTLQEVSHGLAKVKPVLGRLISKKGLQGSVIIDDSYNANPSSVRAALDVLSTFEGERILVLGDLGELGPDTKEYIFELGQYANQLNIERLYTCGDNSRSATEGFGTGAIHFSDQKELIGFLSEQLDEDVAVLVKGSRSARMENVVSAISKGNV